MLFLQSVIDGLLLGGIYAVLAIGLTLVFGVIQIVNFAQGQFIMIGMFTAYFMWQYFGLDPIFGSIASFGVAFLIGLIIHKTMIHRVLKASESTQIFLTVGLLIALENFALLVFGSDYRSVHTPYEYLAIEVGSLFINVPYLIAFSVALLVGIILWGFLRYSWWGLAIRAISQDGYAAKLMGIRVTSVYAYSFALGVALTALGGAILLPFTPVSPTVGHHFLIMMFIVVVLGGLGNILGAVVGGLVVGVIQALSAAMLSIQMQDLSLFILFIAILILRPEGILSIGAKNT